MSETRKGARMEGLSFLLSLLPAPQPVLLLVGG